MATVAFPEFDYILSRETGFVHISNTAVDYMSDGTPRVRSLGTTRYVRINCKFEALTFAEKAALTEFVSENAANTITWTIDGIDYSGIFEGDCTISMTGNRFTVTFVYYASIV